MKGRKMRTFKEFLEQKGSFDEGFIRNMAMGACLLGGIGCGAAEKPVAPTNKVIQSSSETSSDAKDFLPKKAQGIGNKSITFDVDNSQNNSVTSSNAKDFLPKKAQGDSEEGQWMPPKNNIMPPGEDYDDLVNAYVAQHKDDPKYNSAYGLKFRSVHKDAEKFARQTIAKKLSNGKSGSVNFTIKHGKVQGPGD
jgi:hypothetical protein